MAAYKEEGVLPFPSLGVLFVLCEGHFSSDQKAKLDFYC